MAPEVKASPGGAASLLAERRETARIRTPAGVRIRGLGGGSGPEVSTIVDNVSAGGFYVRLVDEVEPGSRLSAAIIFPSGSGRSSGAARLAVRGRILRVESLPGGAYGVAVRILRHRFF